MKIGKKLKQQIGDEIRREGEQFRRILDDLDRSNAIPHELWAALHQTHVITEELIRMKILLAIANYHRP